MRAVSLRESLGLQSLRLAWAQTKIALAGDAFVPKARFDATSLGILRPALSLSLWAGRLRDDRLTPILNLVNRTPTPTSEGWSVRRTQLSDFRGRALTYDSHDGTDFCVPPGTPVVAAAPGRVLGERREYQRGGLKLYVDHGGGLVTTYNHLARALVRVGETVRRGDRIALSGAAGLDATMLFPWLAPHLHFNVWLNGVAVDPFAREAETSLWREPNAPSPAEADLGEEPGPVEHFDAEPIERALATCRDPRFAAAARAIPDVDRRAIFVLAETIIYPTRFEAPQAGRLLYPEPAPRTPRLDLPFERATIRGIWFPDTESARAA